MSLVWLPPTQSKQLTVEQLWLEIKYITILLTFGLPHTFIVDLNNKGIVHLSKK